jgi:hypothetical protein
MLGDLEHEFELPAGVELKLSLDSLGIMNVRLYDTAGGAYEEWSIDVVHGQPESGDLSRVSRSAVDESGRGAIPFSAPENFGKKAYMIGELTRKGGAARTIVDMGAMLKHKFMKNR